jgi:GNAT superfamily N-acetyltransferase
MTGPVTAAELDQVEEVYRERGTAVQIELCPLADPSLLALLAERGYRVTEYSNVLARSLGSHEPDPPAESEVQVRVPLPEEAELWARTVGEGFAQEETARSSLLPLFLTFFHTPTTTCFLGSVDGQPAGGGVVAIEQGVAALFAASTRPAFRKRGVQTALLRARLTFALEAGSDLAMVITLPGSTSQRNAERQGFRVMYTRSKMLRE